MGHFEAGQCHIRIYSKFEYKHKRISQIRIFKRPIFFGRSSSVSKGRVRYRITFLPIKVRRRHETIEISERDALPKEGQDQGY